LNLIESGGYFLKERQQKSLTAFQVRLSGFYCDRIRSVRWLKLVSLLLAGCLVFTTIRAASGKDNGVSLKPPLGWSSWSFIRKQPDEAKIRAQALTLHHRLQSHGFQYINLDDFWYLDPRRTVDAYGHWVVDSAKFPNGIAALANYIHGLGLKFGIYVTPGIPVAAYSQNTPIKRTKYHARDIADTTRFETNYNFGENAMYYIDYSRPGAQEFINSWARLFASWGVDYLKIDGVGSCDVADVKAWSEALKDSGRPIHLGLSNSLALSDGATWHAYANSWRITGDVEAYLPNSINGVYPLTKWQNVFNHFVKVSQWTRFGGPGGWNDLDSLEVGNGNLDGTNAGTSQSDFFTQDERQTVMSWWAIAAAPLLLGTDLTQNQDQFDDTLLRNDEVLAVDQAGVPGAPIDDYLHTDPDQSNGSIPEIWRSKQPDSTYAVVVSNLAPTTQTVSAHWINFGFGGDAIVRDLWNHTNLVADPSINGGYKFASSVSLNLMARQSALVKVTPLAPVTQYPADASGNTVTGGTHFSNNAAATDGRAAGEVGNGGSVVFNNIDVRRAGIYNVTFLYFNGDPSRPASIRVNGRNPLTLDFPGTGSFQRIGGLTVQLQLRAGSNSIAISAPGSSYAPDFDSINIPAHTAQYLADAAVLFGSRIAVTARTVCTDGRCVTNVGNGNSLIFKEIPAGTAQTKVTFIYLSGVPRSVQIQVNGRPAINANFPATSADSQDFTKVGAITVKLPLDSGSNTIAITNPHAPAPDFDSIIVAD
jgi:hypothetical protein